VGGLSLREHHAGGHCRLPVSSRGSMPRAAASFAAVLGVT
jgi:hypothetical protein